jgi:DNA-binding PadR family transcriptional regulator
MEQCGWIRSEWKVTETNREAKFYRLNKAGQKELLAAEKSFEQIVKGVRAVLRYT